MKLAKIINVFNTTEVLAGDPNLTHAGKWVLYSVRKQLADHSEFQREELQKLFELVVKHFHGTLRFLFSTNIIKLRESIRSFIKNKCS